MSQIELIDLREDSGYHCQDEIDRDADLILEFMAAQPPPEAINVPFGTQPINLWAGTRARTSERSEWNSRLARLKRKTHTWLPILRRLWQSAEPLGVEVEEEAFEEICAAGVPSISLNRIPVPVRPLRLTTPRYTCDTAQMDNCSVATMLGGISALSELMREHVIEAARNAVSSPLTASYSLLLIRTEPKTWFKQEAFMFEMFHYLAFAGMIYEPDPTIPPPVPFTAIPPLPPLPEPVTVPSGTLPIESYTSSPPPEPEPPPPPAPRLLDLS